MISRRPSFIRMRTLALSAALALLPFQVGCDWVVDASDHYRDDFQYSYNVKPGARLVLDSFNGSVEIVGWEQNTVQITGTKYAGREETLKELRIETKADDNSVVIRTVRPFGRANCGAKFIIRAPRQIRLERIQTSNGGIRVEDIQGDATLETSNGGVRLRKVQGRADARTSNGSIEIEDLTGDSTLRTSNSSIRLTRIAGAVEATTSNGGIHLRMLKPKSGQALRFQSSNGPIELELDSFDNSSVRASTSNSGITVRLPASVKADVRAGTSNGGITTDFEVTSHGSIEKNHLEGKINGGGPLLDLSTSNGRIRIQKL